MKQEWGRRSYYRWPSRKPVWTITALALAALSVPLIGWARFEITATPLERFYLGQYMRAAMTESFTIGGRTTNRYELVNVVLDRKGTKRLATDADLAPGETSGNGQSVPFILAPEIQQKGALGLMLDTATFNNARVYQFLQHWIYQDQTLGDLTWPALAGALGLLGLMLVVAVPKDLERARVRRHGRRLKGPELVTAAEFNVRNRADGIGFVNLEPATLSEKILRRHNRTVNLAREREAMHMLIMGDSGTGKSALIRQLLMQVDERGESAIVYDPALEYAPQFYDAKRGDVILNPLDTRMPYWSPGEEVQHEAEALTLAASLFPDSHRENPFFVEGPRKVFAHLLTLRPTPEELVWWLSHEGELDRRVKGTELAAMIYPGAAAQRAGVLASLNMVADSLKLLPARNETQRTWTAAEWSRERKGWLFLTSTPEFRKRLLPLTSLWLDLLVLRLMNQGRIDGRARKTWFVLDELATLQKLPQLHTAITENRKSNCPVVLGFQGRSQLEARYGHEAEAMFSQPLTKIFLRTSEPKSAKWISDTIGEVEIERIRESRTEGQFPQSRRSRGDVLERQVEPLVMASEIAGLEPLHGYLKSGNLVVRMRFPYIELARRAEPFVARELKNQQLKEKSTAASVPAKPPTPAMEQHARETKTVAVNEQQPFFE